MMADRNRASAAIVIASVASLCAASMPVRAEVIDRILAVVAGQIITLSDARAALQFGLVPADVSADPIRAAMQRLIDRRLMLDEVERYAQPEPPATAVEAAVNAMQARFKDPLEFEIALNQTAMPRDELRRFLRDSLRIDAYVRQRFASSAPVSDDDLLAFYRERPEEFGSGGKPRPFEEVREQIRARLTEDQRETFVRQWVEGLRRRAAIQVVYLPGR